MSGSVVIDPGDATGAQIAVLGGGITGLAAAHRIQEVFEERGICGSVVLIEPGSTLGGQIRTDTVDGTLVEGGPDTLVLAKPAGLSLCERLGLRSDVVPLEAAGRGAQILHRGRLVDVPDGFMMTAPTRFWPVVRSPLFSLRGKLRMALEPWVPARAPGEADESLGSFVTRRFGREVLERVAEPILASLFTADADHLSLRTAMPRFLEMEAKHGSVTRAIVRARRERERMPAGKHAIVYSGVASVRGGFGRIVDALRSRIPAPSVMTDAHVEEIVPGGGDWIVRLRGDEPLMADAIVFACPAFATAALLRPIDPDLANDLARLRYATCATVNLLYRESDFVRPLTSFGFFVPRTENRSLLACSFVSEKFPDRSPPGTVLLRAFLGGALHPEVADAPEGDLTRLAHDEIRDVLGIRANPVFSRVYRFRDAMPQYGLDFPARLDSIVKRLENVPGAFLAGSAVGAVGIPDCVASGERAAGAAVDHAVQIASKRRLAG